MAMLEETDGRRMELLLLECDKGKEDAVSCDARLMLPLPVKAPPLA